MDRGLREWRKRGRKRRERRKREMDRGMREWREKTEKEKRGRGEREGNKLLPT